VGRRQEVRRVTETPGASIATHFLAVATFFSCSTQLHKCLQDASCSTSTSENRLESAICFKSPSEARCFSLLWSSCSCESINEAVNQHSLHLITIYPHRACSLGFITCACYIRLALFLSSMQLGYLRRCQEDGPQGWKEPEERKCLDRRNPCLILIRHEEIHVRSFLLASALYYKLSMTRCNVTCCCRRRRVPRLPFRLPALSSVAAYIPKVMESGLHPTRTGLPHLIPRLFRVAV
jgi:hypothetical protein